MKSTNRHLDSTLEKIKRYRPIDDTFFEKIAEDMEVCEEILRVILRDKTLKVVEAVTQKSIKNMQGRSVRLDVLCVRGDSRMCNIEVQISNKVNHLKRVRYNASCITTNITEPGVDFEKVPDVSVVYITEKDFFEGGRTIYHVGPIIKETRVDIDNGLEEIYVNTDINDGSDIAELMECFLQTEVNNDKFPKLSARIHNLKHSKEGIEYMCRIADEFREEGREEGREEVLQQLLRKLSIEEMVQLGFDREMISQVAEAM